ASIRRATVRRAAVGRATAQRAAVRRAAVRTGGVPAPGLILFRIVVLPAPRRPCHALHPPVTDVSIALFRVRRGKADPCAGGAETDETPDVADVFIVFLGTFRRRRREG